MAPTKLKTLEAIAYHEAGHAVAAYHLRVGVGRQGVSIVPNESRHGFAHVLKGFSGEPDTDPTDQMRLGAEKNAVVTLAGEAAQRRFRPTSVRRHHGESDWDQVVYLMSYFAGSDRELDAYLKLLQIRAKEFVENPVNWKMIEAVAKALMDRKRLTAGEVKGICLDELRRA